MSVTSSRRYHLTGPESRTGPSPASAALIDSARRRLTNNYRQQSVVMERGDGCWLWDTDGRRYLDMSAGVAVCSLGHAHPLLAVAVAQQMRTLVHASNLYFLAAQVRLAEALAQRTFPSRAFFCNSGAEANEAALKLARRFHSDVCGRPDRRELVSFHGSFHGRTCGALSVTGQEKPRQGFGELVGPVRFLPFNDPAAVRLGVTDQTCAVIVEPVQGEGGVRPATAAFLRTLRDRCDETGTVLIFDEVQVGVGRTGTFWAYEHTGVIPDVLTSAKGLAGGIPIGALLAGGRVAEGFAPGSHASTFGGNPVACVAALTVMDVIDADDLLGNCTHMGAHLGRGLDALAAKHRPLVAGTRGLGLMRGLELVVDAVPLVSRCRELGLLVSAAGSNVLRFTPPLIVTSSEIDEALAIVDLVLTGVCP
jgi:acetylornithine/N-succinyldiaminopimelate aminotransferase